MMETGRTPGRLSGVQFSEVKRRAGGSCEMDRQHGTQSVVRKQLVETVTDREDTVCHIVICEV